ncbi:hypothetical protein F5X97DRAFT_265193 [Nemania serpens]|nr:hypothetical protein F5X97DRAFT_265193 [Nemania serpens]
MATLPPGVDLSQVPLVPNPNGSPPNFNGGPTLEPTILGTGIVFIALSIVCVLIRLRTGLVNTRRLYADDYLCVLALVSGTAYWFVFYELQVKAGITKHSWDVAVSSITATVNKAQVAAQILTVVANATIKSSILSFFVRLFGTLRWIRLLCGGMIALVAVLYGSYLISLLALCIPSAGGAWDSALLARCNTTTPGTITVAVVTVIIDITMFAIPFFIIASLNVKRQTKKSLVVVFFIGFLIVIASIVGLAYKILIASGTPDPLWNGANVSITAYTEIFGSIIVSCAPSLSSFWLNSFITTNIYSSLRSKFSRHRLQDSTQENPSVQTPYSASEHSHAVDKNSLSQLPYKETVHMHRTTSEEAQIESDVQMQTIHKSTFITQHAAPDTDEQFESHGGALGVRHPYRKQW